MTVCLLLYLRDENDWCAEMVINEDIINISVREIMSSPIVYAAREETIKGIATKMKEYNISHLVVLDENEPLGIITKDILVYNVLAKDNINGEMPVKDLPLEPLVTVKADTSAIDLARIFARKHLSLVGVTYKGKLVGVVSAKDIIRIIPDIIDALKQRETFEKEPVIKANATIMGYCDRCGVWSDKLVFVDGKYYCPDCVADLFGEEVLTE